MHPSFLLCIFLLFYSTQIFCADQDSTRINGNSFPAQTPLIIKPKVKHGNVFNGKAEMSYNEVLFMLKNNPSSQTQFIQGKKLRKISDGLFAFGMMGVSIGVPLLSINAESNDNTLKPTDYIGSILVGIGVPLLIASIPVNICGKKLVRKSIDIYNQSPPQKARNTTLSVISGNVYNDDAKMKYDSVIKHLAGYPESKVKYIRGERFKRAGNAIFICGMVTLGIGGIRSFIEGDESYSAVGYEIGLSLMIASIPFKIIGKNTVRKAIDMYNQPPLGTSRSNNIQYQFGLSAHGLTFQLRF